MFWKCCRRNFFIMKKTVLDNFVILYSENTLYNSIYNNLNDTLICTTPNSTDILVFPMEYKKGLRQNEHG